MALSFCVTGAIGRGHRKAVFLKNAFTARSRPPRLKVRPVAGTPRVWCAGTTAQLEVNALAIPEPAGDADAFPDLATRLPVC